MIRPHELIQDDVMMLNIGNIGFLVGGHAFAWYYRTNRKRSMYRGKTYESWRRVFWRLYQFDGLQMTPGD